MLAFFSFSYFSKIISNFSSWGPTNELTIKPEITAPGENILSTLDGRDNYTTQSGTSMATPFVTGSTALLMEWGIVKGNDEYLYGEKVKAYLIKGARELAGFDIYPNAMIGWGALCVENSLPI